MNARHAVRCFCLISVVISAVVFVTVSFAAEEQLPFYPGGTYTSGIPAPDDILGYPSGSRPVTYDEAALYFRTLADASPRVTFHRTGKTYEGRDMFYVIVSGEDNMSKLDTIRGGIAKLADPRVTTEDEARGIVESSPAVMWLMYSIHGNEVSGSDASLMVAYQLAAGTDAATEKLRRELVIGIWPMQNPDGRERFLGHIRQWNGAVPNSDSQALQHTGVWPWGRTNHYLFDLNRDWFILAHPESRARVGTLLEWNPQVVVDIHEMGSYDTYLFNPPREPVNRHVNESIRRWWRVFSKDQAKAFDRYGWSYYTKEWLEDWYPGYTTSWSDCIGAIGILYEQAYTGGSQVKRPDGTILTFREAVHHHFTSSIANLTTAADNRQAILGDYYAMKVKTLDDYRKADVKAYIIDPTRNPSRARRLTERLLLQGIELETAREEFRVKNVRNYWDDEPSAKTFPAGTIVISLNQPLRPLIDAILEFDPRLSTEFLESEREHLSKHKGTRMYEVSTWSMLIAYGLDAWTAGEEPQIDSGRLTETDSTAGAVVGGIPAFGWLVDYNDDSTVGLLVKLLERGAKVRSAKKPFTVEGRSYPRGTLLVRKNENGDDIASLIADVAKESGATVYGAGTALSDDGPDLGGREFELLEAPRIGLLCGQPIGMYSFGTIWHMLDIDLGARFSLLNFYSIGGIDLRRYNVLILPSASPASCRAIIGDSIGKIRDWVSDGGTLIAIEDAAAFLSDSTTAMSAVRLRRQSLDDLDAFDRAVLRERAAGEVTIDSLYIWEGKRAEKQKAKEEKPEEEPKKPSREEREELDAYDRLFYPRGATLTADADVEHWLTFGTGARIPAHLYTTYAFLTKEPVETAARLSDSENLRVSGLLWPEARQRWQKTAYATRESLGRGQIILFAGDPVFRSYFYCTSRMLINAIFLGPGFGTSPVVGW